MDDGGRPVAELSFEDALKELEAVVSQLESGNVAPPQGDGGAAPPPQGNGFSAPGNPVVAPRSAVLPATAGPITLPDTGDGGGTRDAAPVALALAALGLVIGGTAVRAAAWLAG